MKIILLAIKWMECISLSDFLANQRSNNNVIVDVILKIKVKGGGWVINGKIDMEYRKLDF